MKKLLLSFFLISIVIFFSLGQESHLSLIYDFEGEDFDYDVKGMVGTNDSLYVICNTPNNKGLFFRIDEEGEGYEVIWEFDNINYLPNSLIANDTVIYGTTRASANGGGTLFKYSLQDYSFKFIKDFNSDTVKEVRIKYISDTVLWLYSQWSPQDKGSIFTIKKDGTQLKKIYNDMNQEKGQNPVDFVFHNDSIYIACFNGGGIPYPDGTGSYVSSGSFIRIHTDGTGYENLIQGSVSVGTQPTSIIIRENKLFGLFAYTGLEHGVGGQFFRSNLDGTQYDSLGGLSRRAYTKMLTTDSLIYGISFSQIFGINPFDGEIRIYDDLLDNPDFGYDVVSNPALLNGNVYISAQQGGPDGGGTILKWQNQDPKINESKIDRSKSSTEIVLKDLFTDPEGDSLSYDFEYNKEEVSYTLSNGKLVLTPLQSGEVKFKIIANDGWVGYNSLVVTLGSATSNNLIEKTNQLIYPNPTNSVIRLGSNEIKDLEVLTLDGILIRSYKDPSTEIDVSFLENGVYLFKYQLNGNSYSQKILKI